MEPQHNQSPGMQLPPPVAEQLPTAPAEGQPAQPEQAPAGVGERLSAAGAPMPMPATIPAPTLPSLPVTQAGGSAASSGVTTALPADDGDLIEKEWVEKAKTIVEHTRSDPHQQSEQLTGVKADYMKQRYNKVIKLNN